MTEEERGHNCNLVCFCGKPTTIYDGLFERNFCSPECVNVLRTFFAHSPDCHRLHSKVAKAIEAGDFKIQGGVVTLLGGEAKAKSFIDRITDTVGASLEKWTKEDKMRKDLKKLGLPDAVVDSMIAEAMKAEAQKMETKS